jgi:FixJ family two-component response regulator
MIATAQQIIVVENDPGLSQAIEQILQVSGYDTRAFPSGEALLECADALEADCFLIEVELPGMSGIELRKQLSAHGKSMPVVFMTPDDIPASFDRHFDARFLHKPFRGYRLISAIRTAINTEGN